MPMMEKLKDWTVYVFAGIVVAAALAILWYCVNFDIYKTDDPPDKQFNEPELKVGVWRLGHQPNMGADLQVGMFAVYKVPGSELRRVARVVAMEGQKVEVKGEEVIVDGSAIQNPTRQNRSRFDVPELTVPRRCVFVVSDLRSKGASADYDSRGLGPIPLEAITHCFKPLKAGS
jgi:signal peptidase I